jgi:hypothetical protein
MNAYTAPLREGVPRMDGLRPLERPQVEDVTTVYLDNYRQLVRIAALMLRNRPRLRMWCRTPTSR